MRIPLFAFVIALASSSEPASLTPVITAISTIVEIMGQVFAVMTSNPLLVVFLAASLLTLGVRLFRKFKGAARG